MTIKDESPLNSNSEISTSMMDEGVKIRLHINDLLSS